MSYLEKIDGIPDFSKAVISFWFRVPQASVDAAAKAYDPQSDAPLNGIIPLVIMGKQGSSNKIDTVTTQAPFRIYTGGGAIARQIADSRIVYDGGGGQGILFYSVCETTYSVECIPVGEASTDTASVSESTGTPVPRNPTCIGVDCSTGSAVLYVNFETAKPPTITDAADELRSIDPVTITSTGCFDPSGSMLEGSVVNYCFRIGGSLGPPPGGFPPGMPPMGDHATPFVSGSSSASGGDGAGNPVYHYVDISDIKYGETGAIESDVIPVSADTWHHVLISVDIKDIKTHGHNNTEDVPENTNAGVESAATLYIAFDDENKTKLDLSENWVDGGGNNEVITGVANTIVYLTPAQDHDGNQVGGLPQYSLTEAKVPSSTIAFGLPGTKQFTDNILKVEMAEFLMWTGVTLDTSIEENRRHFITAPNKNGRQFPTNSSPLTIPYRKFAFGDPTKWEPGADNPAFAPPLFDPSLWPTGIKGLGVAQVDFTKCSFNWMMGRNLGKVKGKFEKTGKIRTYWPSAKGPDVGSDPVLEPKPGS